MNTSKSKPRVFAEKSIQLLFAVILAFGLMVPSLALAPPKAAYAGSSSETAAVPEIDSYLAENSEDASDDANSYYDTGMRMISKQTFVTDKASDSKSIDDFFARYGQSEMVTTLTDSTIPIFGIDGDDSQFMAFVGKSAANTKDGEIIAWDVTDDNPYDPQIFNEQVNLDAETGILYIPRDVLVDENNSVLPHILAAQTLVATPASNGESIQDALQSTITVSIDNQSGTATAQAPLQNVELSAIDTVTTIPVITEDTASALTVDDFDVYINGSEMPINEGAVDMTYNGTTGELTIGLAPADLSRVDIEAKDQGFFNKIFGTTKAYAGITSTDDMRNLSDVVGTIKVTKGELKEGSLYVYQGYLDYGKNNKGRKSRNNILWKDGWRYEVAKKVQPYVYVSNTGSESRAARHFFTAELEKFTWDNFISWYGAADNGKEDWQNWLWNFMFALPVNDEQDLRNAFTGDEVRLNFPNAVYDGHYNVLGTCVHLSADLDEDDLDEDVADDLTSRSVLMRVLKLDEAKGEVVLGFGGSKESDNQDGYGIYKFSLETTGKLTLQKTSANTSITNGNNCYSLQGAEYGIYKSKADAANNANKVETLTTDANGKSNQAELPAATYYIKEIKASKGYELDETIYDVTLESGDEKVQNVKETPGGDPIQVLLQKIDDETQEGYPLEGASLKGAKFEVKYWANPDGSTSGTPTRTWVYETDEDGYINIRAYLPISGEVYKNSDGIPVFPIGTYTIQETAAPEGYLLDSKILGTYVLKTTDNGNSLEWTGLPDNKIVSAWNAPSVPNKAIRGDYKFVKIGDDQKGLPNVPFIIEGVTSGEKHIIVTDKNGMASTENTWNAHSSSTNANDAGYTEGSENYDSSKINNKAGLWFGTNTNAKRVETPNDKLGALPYGEYKLTELRCEANKDYNLVERTFWIERNGVVVDGGTITDTSLRIGTTATVNGAKTFLPSGEVTIDDLVKYEGLTPGKEYILTASLMDADKVEPIKNNDEPVVSEPVSFTPNSKNGEITVPIKFDASDYDKAKFVVYEKLTDADGNTVATHEDPEDKDQTVESKPDGGTTATDKADGDHQIPAAKNQTIVDEVEYEGLIAGKEYTVTGVLMVKSTEKPLLDSNGKEITQTKDFTAAEGGEGTVPLEFTIDASLLSGEEIVAFETVTRDGIEVFVHADINDPKQTIEVIPEIGTTATDKADGDHNIEAAAKQVIVDKVSYNGLKTDTKYIMVGTLMDKATEKPLEVAGKTITQTKEFTPSETSGSVDLEFELDAAALAGKTTVVFEKAYVAAEYKESGDKAKPVATHEDITDKGQTITVGPTIGTTATNKADSSHTVAISDDKVTVVDTVEYDGLVAGETYVMSGTLMNKTTGKPLEVDGKIVANSQEFVAKKSSGTVEIEFSFDASKLSEGDLVAYEQVYTAANYKKSDKGTPIAKHEDIKDKSQTVTVTKNKTPSAGGGKTTSGGSSSSSEPTAATLAKTGLAIPVALLIALAAAGLVYGWMRIRQQEDE